MIDTCMKSDTSALANSLMLNKLSQMNSDLQQMQRMQSTLEVQKSEDRNLVASLLFERVSLAMAK